MTADVFSIGYVARSSYLFWLVGDILKSNTS
jgi:hypothetical protein